MRPDLDPSTSPGFEQTPIAGPKPCPPRILRVAGASRGATGLARIGGLGSNARAALRGYSPGWANPSGAAHGFRINHQDESIRFASRGREAAPLRKVLFALVLVAASFSGGAVVNGPGLRWARDLILNEPGAEIATT